MARLSSTARVSITGRDAAEARDAAIEQKSWLVWARAHSLLADGGGKPHSLDGMPGIAGELNLRGVVCRLWPELAASDKRPEMDAFIAPIYEYLKKSGNARCVLQPLPGSGRRPVWWLRGEWLEVLAVHVGMAARSEDSYLSRREKQLTPTEVGEDRPAAPVEVRFMEPPSLTKSTEAVDKLRPYLEKRSREHVDLVGMVQLVLEDSSQPLTALELQQYLERELNYVYEITTVRNAIKELLAAKKISSRKESPDERNLRAGGTATGAHAMLYWAPPGEVPARTEREAVTGVILEVDWAARFGATSGPQEPTPAVTVTDTGLAGADLTGIAAAVSGLIDREVTARIAVVEDRLAKMTAERDRLAAELKALEPLRQLAELTASNLASVKIAK